MTVDLDAVLDWVQTTQARPVAAHLVPGASEDERRMLGVLGGLVSAIVPAEQRIGWPADVLRWVSDGPHVPADVSKVALQAITENPDEVLADIYARLVSGANRRPLGTFFTPAREVEPMLDMWAETEDAPAAVVDVGAGVGVFTASAASRWPEAQVFGVDINPVTLGLLALRAWIGAIPLHEESSPKPGVRVVRQDFTTWIDELGEMPAPRLILGNPPYTRSQLLSPSDRERLSTAAGGLCGSRASLSALITAISLRKLGPSDGLSFLLPAQWLESQYASSLRNYLGGLEKRRIELRLVDHNLFDDAQVDAVVLQVGPEHYDNQDFVTATWTKMLVSQGRRSIDRGTLLNVSWRTLFVNTTVRSTEVKTNVMDAPLSDYCALRRGTATGSNGFFLLSDDEVEKYELGGYVTRVVRRLHGYSDSIGLEEFDSKAFGEKRWLLTVTPEDRETDARIDRYLSIGEQNGVNDAYLCRVRPVAWYDLRHDLVVPDVIVGPMTRGAVRFVENHVRAAVVNNLYGWSWREGVDKVIQTKILQWLRSSTGQGEVLAAARQQGTGLKKIEPKALSGVRVPAAVARSPRTLL